MRSPFGEKLRRMRLDRGLKLKDLAEALTITPAFLSAVETGKKPVPQSLIDKLTTLWGLDEEDVDSLTENAEFSSDNINVSHIPFETRKFVHGLARTLPELRDLSEEDQEDRLKQFLEEVLSQIRK